MDGEWARVHVADGVDQANHPAGSAHVQASQGTGLAERRQMEERVAGEPPLALGDQPVVELNLLRSGRVQIFPDVCAPPGGTQPGDSQRGTVTACQ